ncbi:shikimate dehydrogenase family protein [Boudabousia marimammalium]|uniref:Shikimate dehydrogenase n=1 Tax=Boudabousia marimammalium TaxID=156892 RepID=A0A1Q5PRH0_9ACTO|nr:hypothetical protein [Boudabousia marimammalium]OKL50010.1 hypothetical protein BM477_03715 [Boudabousia marimammalium]
MLRRYAVIGHPVSHSLSPVIHEAGYRALGIEAEFVTHDVSDLDSEWPEISYYDGLAVTTPLKQQILQYCDVIEPMAKGIGAVNTVINAGGIITGLNTDVYGIVTAIRVKTKRAHFSNMVILGGRASASSALAASGELGRPNLTVIARSLSGPGTVSQASSRLGVRITPLPWRMTEAAKRALGAADLVFSTVPNGVADSLCEGLEPRPDAVYMEASYADAPSCLSRTFAEAGATVVHGTEMLLYQGLQQFALMTGCPAPEPEMRAALDAALRRR